MGRKSLKDIRRKEIIEVYYKVASEEGLKDTSISKIANELECNPSLIIHYFESKDELVYGLVDFIIAKFQCSVFVDLPEIRTREELRDYIKFLLNQRMQILNNSLFYSCFALGFSDNIIKKKFQMLNMLLEERARDFLGLVQKNGLIKTDNIEQKIESFLTILEGSYYRMVVLNDDEKRNNKMNQHTVLVFECLDL